MNNTHIHALGVTGDTHAVGVMGNTHIHALEVTDDKHTCSFEQRLKISRHGYPSLYQLVRSRAPTPTLTTREVRDYSPLGRPLWCTVHGCILAALEYAAESLNISVHAITSTHSHPHDTRGQCYSPLGRALWCTVHGRTLATVEHAAGSLNISVHAFTSTHSHPHDTRGKRLLTLRKATTVHPRCTVHRCTLTA